MQKNRKKVAMIVAIILAALMILPMLISGLSMLFPEAQAAVTQKDIDKTKETLKALKENKKKLENELSSLKNLKADIVQRKRVYDEQIATIEEEMLTVNDLISQINLAVAEQQQELDEKIALEAELREQYIARVQAMEAMGEISYLSIFLQAESLTDMLTRWEAVREIMARDQRLADDLVASRLEIEERMAQLDADKQEQYELKRELAASYEELAALSSECDAAMAEYVAQMAQYQVQLAEEDKRIADAQKELSEQEAEVKRIAELMAKSNNKYVGGEYMWPVPGRTTISSPYGNRIHPIYKVKKFHTGIDIPAPKGTKVVAANSGKILVKTYSSGYGNYIVIDHGGGQATLYAHLSGFANFKVGDAVSVGEVIGYVGSTGLSTGNHLHFEIQKGGTHVNPVPLLTGKK